MALRFSHCGSVRVKVCFPDKEPKTPVGPGLSRFDGGIQPLWLLSSPQQPCVERAPLPRERSNSRLGGQMSWSRISSTNRLTQTVLAQFGAQNDKGHSISGLDWLLSLRIFGSAGRTRTYNPDASGLTAATSRDVGESTRLISFV